MAKFWEWEPQREGKLFVIDIAGNSIEIKYGLLERTVMCSTDIGISGHCFVAFLERLGREGAGAETTDDTLYLGLEKMWTPEKVKIEIWKQTIRTSFPFWFFNTWELNVKI